MRATVYWLIPAKPYRELFRQIIRILAKQFSAPRFEPHLTLFFTLQDRPSAEKILRQIKVRPIRLILREIGFSPKFTKTLFVRCKSSKALENLIVDLAQAANSRAKSISDPHVSLLYKKVSTSTKKELASTIKLPFREIVFDSIKAVRCSLPIRHRADVEAWRVVATKSLR